MYVLSNVLICITLSSFIAASVSLCLKTINWKTTQEFHAWQVLLLKAHFRLFYLETSKAAPARLNVKKLYMGVSKPP